VGFRAIQSKIVPGTYYFSGSDAVAEGAIAGGCRFYGGYPITPSSEIMERIARRFKEISGVFLQMEDEIASISSVIGASWAGAKAMTATSGPGLSLMMETIGYAAFTETPIVIVDIQRAGPCTGQATHVGSGDIMQIKWGSHGDYQIIAYSPWSVQEMYDFTIKAFNMAEKYRVPCFVMGSEVMVHLRERILVKERVKIYDREKSPGSPPFDTEDPDGVPPMPCFGEGENLLVTGSTHDGYGFRKSDDPAAHERLVQRLHRKIMDNRHEIIETEQYFLEEGHLDVVVVAYGFTSRSALYAIQDLHAKGKKVGLIRLRTLWPFADKLIRDVSIRVGQMFVPEMNMGQVSTQVMQYARCPVATYNQTNGETITPKKIIEELGSLI